ncbi:MAG: HAD family hydrolase [Chloroflexi bacterium]|nr:HAD family hydrolase [Chloroflexota bacterium]
MRRLGPAGADGWASVDTVIFDFDGTLVNSLDCYHAVFLDSFSRLGLPVVDKTALLELMRTGQNILELLIPAGWPGRDDVKKQCQTLFRDLWAERSVEAVSIHAEVIPTITTLCARGYGLGVATAAQGPWIHHLLEQHQLAPCFGAIVTYADVPVRKPAPDLLLECLRRLSREAERSVYVGDSPIDIIAAKAAGVRSIGVLSGASDRASLEEVEPGLILEHVGQLPAVLEMRSSS